MNDDRRKYLLSGTRQEWPAGQQAQEQDSDEETCGAFGFLRGIRDQALAVEFRLQDGYREWFPYSWLGPWKYNPSVGLLLKFTGDVMSLVLIRGSNLDALVRQRSVNLTDRGFQRHRITYVREMSEQEIRKAADGEPTIDRIEIAEFESQEEIRQYLEKTAPAFLRQTG